MPSPRGGGKRMRRVDWTVLAVGAVAAFIWTVFSGKDGFKSNSAVIVSRSISITSTIDGHVDNEPPEVGARVNPSELLVRIHDNRIDRGRLIDFDSEIEFLQSNIASAERQQEELDALLQHFQEKAAAHAAWVKDDVELRKLENVRLLEIAEHTRKIKSDQAARTSELYAKKHASSALADTAKAEAAIAASQVELSRTQIRRDQLLQRSLVNNGAFFDNGDASYWDRMADEITLRQLDNLNNVSTLNAQLNRARAQAGVERTRIGSSVEEEHLAPFAGLVNATYVDEGTRVARGTRLLQILDCANPIVIVPLPEHRIAEFAAGMNVTVYPVDTEDELPGRIEYISSGPLIGHDQTLLVQEDLTVRGVRAVVSFTEQRFEDDPTRPCQSAHRAVVVVHTESVVKVASTWVASLF